MPRPMKRKYPGRQPGKGRGFAALEQLVGVASLFLVILAGQPLVSHFYDNGPDYLLLNASLMSHLEYARQEAMRRGTLVTICPSSDGRNCNADGDWQQGWMIFTDASKPYRHLSVGDKFLYRQQQLAGAQPRPAFDIIRYQADGSILLN